VIGVIYPTAPSDYEPPDWWRDRPLTDAELDAMAQEYAREQMATAQSEAAHEANIKEHSK
jgi:hypothetical protein